MKMRESNFELLRIVSMFLVLAFHANFFSLGGPNLSEIQSAPISGMTRVFLEALCSVCVNVFVMISGWFGIKPTLKGLFRFLFQCTYCYTAVYVFMILTGGANLSFKGIVECILCNDYWFVVAYLGLFVLSPVLNLFLKNATKAELLFTLIGFYSFQTIYGWISPDPTINFGYSTFSFIGLYILAYYLRYHMANKTSQSTIRKGAFIIVFLSTICISVNYVCTLSLVSFSYCNPFVILSSAGLVKIFAKLNIHSRFINGIAQSTFAVYLLHLNPYVVQQFKDLMTYIYSTYSGIVYVVYILLILAGIFIACIIIDQPRKWIWNQLSKVIFD